MPCCFLVLNAMLFFTVLSNTKCLLCLCFFQLDAPLFVTWFQCVVCLVCLFLLSFLGDKYPWIDKFPAFNIDLKVAREVSCVTILNFVKVWKVKGAVK